MCVTVLKAVNIRLVSYDQTLCSVETWTQKPSFYAREHATNPIWYSVSKESVSVTDSRISLMQVSNNIDNTTETEA